MIYRPHVPCTKSNHQQTIRFSSLNSDVSVFPPFWCPNLTDDVLTHGDSTEHLLSSPAELKGYIHAFVHRYSYMCVLSREMVGRRHRHGTVLECTCDIPGVNKSGTTCWGPRLGSGGTSRESSTWIGVSAPKRNRTT